MREAWRRWLPPRCRQFLGRLWWQLRFRRRARYLRRQSGQGRELECQVAYTRLGAFCVPLSSVRRPAVQRILRGEVHEPQTMAAMVSCLAEGGDIVHAGTFFGDFLPELSRACGAQGKVWAFEPNPESHRCAQVTCLLNGLDNVHLHHAALGACAGTVALCVRDEQGRALGGRSHVVQGPEAAAGPCVEVPLLCLDEVVPPSRRVAVVQLDVEGSERQALEGASGLLRRCRPVLILEQLPPEAWLQAHLFPLGYVLDGRLHENSVLRVPAEKKSPWL